MSQTRPEVKRLLERHASMLRKRGPFETIYQELRELTRPEGSDFTGASVPGDGSRKIFDGTAPWCVEALASAMHSYLSNPVDLWFSLGVVGVPPTSLTFEERNWLQETADVIYSHYAAPAANLNPSLHELYLDLGSFGTGALYQWQDEATNEIRFRSFPMSAIFVDENSEGEVDTVQRVWKMSIRQVRQEWGNVGERMSKMKDDDMVTIVHEVAPNREPGEGPVRSRPFRSTYVCKDCEELLSESFMTYMPYHVTRWTRVPGEAYGRGPAMAVLPEIRMVNAMRKTVIVAAQKMVDPPLMVEDDGYMLPIRSHPGAIINRRPGSEPIEALPGAQRIDVSVEMVEQSREMIRRGFYIEWILRQQKKERQTAHEVADERNQMLSMMAPVVGRQQRELLGPMVSTSYMLLARAGKLPPMPASLANRQLEIVYVSPAARAQSTARGNGLMGYVSQIAQLLPVMPGLVDSIDEDALNAELQVQFDVAGRVLRSPEEVQAKREQREKQQQAMMAAQAAPQMAKAMKDVASARKDGMAIDV